MVSKSSEELSRDDFLYFAGCLRAEAGIRLEESKRLMVAARLARRVRHLGLRSLHEYRRLVEYEDDTGDERLRMINCLTTNKTDFFREPHHFEFLAEAVARRAATRRSQGESSAFKIWSAGCSTGEEPYSIAITLAQTLPETSWPYCTVIASDIDTEVLGRAEQGIYAAERLDGMPEAVCRIGFLRGRGCWQGQFQVKPTLQRMVTFRRINLMDEQWTVPPQLDFLFCRNVMIYFDRATQQRLVERFAGLLAPEGYLIVGHSESLYGVCDRLELVGSTVYRRRSGA
jgi:chemotaxis protein methyltransferase CheR